MRLWEQNARAAPYSYPASPLDEQRLEPKDMTKLFGAPRLLSLLLVIAAGSSAVLARDTTPPPAKPASPTSAPPPKLPAGSSTALPAPTPPLATPPTTPAPAPINPAKEKSIRQLIQITGADKLGSQIGEQVLAGGRNARPDVPATFWACATARFAASDDLIAQEVRIYDKHYTQSDIDAMIAFYKTPAGQKLVTEAPRVAQETNAFGQNWARERTQQVVADLKIEDAKRSPATPPASGKVTFDTRPFQGNGKVVKTASGLQY